MNVVSLRPSKENLAKLRAMKAGITTPIGDQKEDKATRYACDYSCSGSCYNSCAGSCAHSGARPDFDVRTPFPAYHA